LIDCDWWIFFCDFVLVFFWYKEDLFKIVVKIPLNLNVSSFNLVVDKDEDMSGVVRVSHLSRESE
jgi:hypothetical protein